MARQPGGQAGGRTARQMPAAETFRPSPTARASAGRGEERGAEIRGRQGGGREGRRGGEEGGGGQGGGGQGRRLGSAEGRRPTEACGGGQPTPARWVTMGAILRNGSYVSELY